MTRGKGRAAAIAIIACVAVQNPASAQEADADVVYLKDGSQLRGTLSEWVANDHLTLRLANGQTATVRADVIQRVTHAGAAVAPATAAQPPPPPLQPPPPPASEPRPAGPKTLPYEGEAVPGYHLEEKRRLGLLIPGAILCGLGAIGVIALAADGKRDSATFAAIWGVLFFAPGTPLLLVGLLAPKKKLVRNDLGAAVLAPPRSPFFIGVSAGRSRTGFSLGAEF
ncbi:MAG: hypothetical protein ABIP39_15095 [Polyangiaceae bacterium]